MGVAFHGMCKIFFGHRHGFGDSGDCGGEAGFPAGEGRYLRVVSDVETNVSGAVFGYFTDGDGLARYGFATGINYCGISSTYWKPSNDAISSRKRQARP